MNRLLLSKDKLIAKIDSLSHFTWFDKGLAPLYLQRTSNFVSWLQSRSIDTQRPNSRLLRRALRLTELDDVELVLSVHAVTITDTYWVKDENSPLTWEDVRFKKASFSTLALIGSYDAFTRAASAQTKRTQELTNIGSFEKCWRIYEGSWWLYKQADLYQLFSDLFVYKLGKHLGFPMAQYRPGTYYIRSKTRYIMSKNFTAENLNFEPIVGITGESVENYISTYSKLRKISPSLASDYISILFMDTLLFNPDRHEYNLGILRNADDGAILGLAPNFDNNMALISQGYPKSDIRSKDILITDFNALLDSGIEWFGFSERKKLPVITKSVVLNIIKSIGIKVKEKFIVNYIMSSYELIGWCKDVTIANIFSELKASANFPLMDRPPESVKKIKTDVFYIEPKFVPIETTTNPGIVLFSAAGATGKSTLAKHLSAQTGGLYWDLSKLDIGEGTFQGVLGKAIGFGNLDTFRKALASGSTALIIDAFDEADVRSGRTNVEHFLSDLNEFSQGSEKPTMILLARSESAQFIEKYLSNHGRKISHYEIGLIEENSAKRFVRDTLLSRKISITDAKEAAIEMEFESIKKLLGNASDNFLGYPPVLEALSESIAFNQNTIVLIQELRQGTTDSELISTIMEQLLAREQRKTSTLIKQRLESKYKDFKAWDKVYNTTEQVLLIFQYMLFGEIDFTFYQQDFIPPVMADDYVAAIRSFLPSHPFFRSSKETNGYDFSGPAFRDYCIAFAFLSENSNLCNFAKEYLDTNNNISPLLFNFYMTASKKTICAEHFSYLYDSFRGATKAKHESFVSVFMIDDCKVACEFKKNDATSITAYFKEESPSLTLSNVINTSIDFQGNLTIKSKSGKSRISNSTIICSNLCISSPFVRIDDYKGGATLIISETQASLNSSLKIDFQLDDSNHFKVSFPGDKTFYYLRAYCTDIQSDASTDKRYFTHVCQTICKHFHRQADGSFSRSANLVDKLVSGNWIKEKVFKFLQDLGCITINTTKTPYYILDIEKTGYFGINWQGSASINNDIFDFAYDKFKDWEKDSFRRKS